LNIFRSLFIRVLSILFLPVHCTFIAETGEGSSNILVSAIEQDLSIYLFILFTQDIPYQVYPIPFRGFVILFLNFDVHNSKLPLLIPIRL